MLSVVWSRSSFLSLCCPAELMFNGCFHGLDKHQLLALVSCLVPCDKSNEEVSWNDLLFLNLHFGLPSCSTKGQRQGLEGCVAHSRTRAGQGRVLVVGSLQRVTGSCRAGRGLDYGGADGSLGWGLV